MGAPAPDPGPDRFVAAVAVDGEVLFAGPSVPAVLGIDRGTLTGDNILDHVHQNDRRSVAGALSAVATHRVVTHRIAHASGGFVWVESTVDEELAPEFGGRVVTARRVDADRTFPERFREFLEYGTDIVTVVDADGRVRYESPSVEEVLGYEQGSTVGRSPLGYVHPEDRDRVTKRFYRALNETDATPTMEYRYRTADGDWVWLESKTRTLPDGAAAGQLLINSRDVSDRKTHERRLTDRNERLDRFASIVSHDLRNPLSVIQASMEMARLKDDTGPLERGDRAVERIDQLVTELLTLARQGPDIDEPTEFDLGGVVHDAWETAGHTDATLVLVESAQIRGDRSRLRQVFENLFRNSVEHGSTGRRTESGDSVEHGRSRDGDAVSRDGENSAAFSNHSTGSRAASGDASESVAPDEADGEEPLTVVVSATDEGLVVVDDGPGIDPAIREHVFEPGFTTCEGGTGYGLDIVREAVESHGWTIELRAADAEASWLPETDDSPRLPFPDGAAFVISAPGPTEVDSSAPWIDR